MRSIPAAKKCLSCVPGISPITLSPKAVAAIEARKSPVTSWFLDLNLVMGYWGSGAKRSYHHTAPVNALYALHESLVLLKEEGLEASHARHMHHHLGLRAGLEALGLEFVVEPEYRLPQLNAVKLPAGVDDAAIRKELLNNYGLEIGGGLGALAGKAWRIGLMGYAARKTMSSAAFPLWARRFINKTKRPGRARFGCGIRPLCGGLRSRFSHFFALEQSLYQ